MEQNNMDMLYKKLKKQMVINRVFSIINMVCSISILVVVLLTCVRINDFLDKAEPVIEELEKLDMEQLNEALENLNSVMDFMSWENWAEKLEGIDFEGMKEFFQNVDMDELKETLENINEGAEKLDEVKEWFENSPLNIFKDKDDE